MTWTWLVLALGHVEQRRLRLVFCGYGNWREKESARRSQTSCGEDPGGFDSVGLWRRYEGSTGQAQPRDVEGKKKPLSFNTSRKTLKARRHGCRGKPASRTRWRQTLPNCRRICYRSVETSRWRYKNWMCCVHSWRRILGALVLAIRGMNHLCMGWKT